MSKTKQSPDVTRIAAVVLTFVLLVSLILLALNILDKQSGRFPEMNFGDSSVKYQGKDYEQKSSIETFLVIGLDKYSGSEESDSYINDQQADFIILFVFDNELKSYSAIYINRDTMVDINVLGVAGEKIGTVNAQVALSHTYGNGKEVSCRNVSDAVSRILMGVKVNHYISVKLDAVSLYNELIGGVEVIVLDDFGDIEPRLVKGEKVLLTDDLAMTYIRTRQGLEENTNIARSKRQKQYLDALRIKTEERIASDEQFVIDASMQISPHVISDRSVNQLQEIMKKISQYEFEGFRDIKGESVKGEQFMEFNPDRESVMEMVIDMFYEPKK